MIIKSLQASFEDKSSDYGEHVPKWIVNSKQKQKLQNEIMEDEKRAGGLQTFTSPTGKQLYTIDHVAQREEQVNEQAKQLEEDYQEVLRMAR